MLISTVKKIFGTRNDRELKRMRKVVARINALEEAMQALDDNALRAKTDEFRSRLNEGRNSINCSPRPLPWSARRACVRWVCGTSTCS